MPPVADILPVAAVIAALYYGWSLAIYLYKVPGWLAYLRLSEVIQILAYSFATNLVESLAFLILVLGLNTILPPVCLRDAFNVRGSIFSMIVIGSAMLFLSRYMTDRYLAAQLGGWTLAVFALALAAAIFLPRIRIVRVAVDALSDRLIVFLFLLVPLTAISLLYLIVRALIGSMP